MPRLTVALALHFAATGTAYAACDASPDVTVCTSGCDFSDLSSATATAASNDVICIQGDYTHTGAQVVVNNKALTIQHDGVGTAMVQRGVAGAQIRVQGSGNLTISDVVVDGGNGATVGVWVEATLTATNLTVRNHTGGPGAGLDVDGGSATCTDCTLDNNDAGANNGGNIYVHAGGDIALVGGIVSNGSAADGGGAYSNSGLIGIDGTVFEGNVASSQGGGVYIDASGDLDIDRAWFSGNDATSHGGGVFVDGPDNITVLRTLFCNNDSGDDGGAIHFKASANSAVRGSIFINNHSTDKGGGIYLHDQSVDITNSTFSRNSGGSNTGQAIHNRQAGGDAHSLVLLNHLTALDDESANSDLDYAYNLFFANSNNASGDATATGANNDLFVDPGISSTANACNPGELRQDPFSSALNHAGEAALGNNPAGTLGDDLSSTNTIGAFGGPFAFDQDIDGDGYDALHDCDETNPAVNPGAVDIANDGIDNDCNGSDYLDSDSDGFEDFEDCAPLDPYIYPGAAETPGNGIDEDCSGGDTCYTDDDGDGFGDTVLGYAVGLDCDSEAGLSSVSTDCDDTMGSGAAFYPGAYDVPGNGIDEDCDLVDDCYLDADNDGVGSTIVTGASLDCDSEANRSSTTGDCADNNADRFPGNPEVVGDGVDQDCDGQEICYLDSDGDDFGTSATVVSTDQDCLDAMEADNDLDCLDSDPNSYPGALEVVGDETDQDCDGGEICWFDNDNDDYGSTSTTLSADTDCQDNQEAVNNLDCADGNAAIHPGATDVVGNNLDENCDGSLLCWMDDDGDGSVGDEFSGLAPGLDCDVEGFAYTGNTPDCADTDPDRYPGATEVPANGIDEDCDNVDSCYDDNDGDGYTSSALVDALPGDLSCSASPDYGPTDDGDCNDNFAAIYPGATEIPADNTDQNCDGNELCYVDNDADGYAGSNTLSTPVLSCAGLFTVVEDCNDLDPLINPDAVEEVATRGDQNCDGLERCYVDGDLDGYGGTATTTTSFLTCMGSGVSPNNTDCNDGVDAIRPGVSEIAYDFVDQNCDGLELCAQDSDNDGFGSITQTQSSSTIDCSGAGVSENQLDCNDGNAGVNPDATELPADDRDQDCDGLELCYEDLDLDTWGSSVQVLSSSIFCSVAGVADRTGDCIDESTTVDPTDFYPGAPEVPGDGADQDCDGYDLRECYQDLDGDGIGTPILVPDATGQCTAAGFSTRSTDCDDTRADVNPDVAVAADTCDGIDNNCSEAGKPCAGDDDWDQDGLCNTVGNSVNGTDSELDLLTDDCAWDSDGDGWGDGEEARDPLFLDPADADTDGDGVDDGDEWTRDVGLPDPSLSPKADWDQDGVPDVVDLDDDDDGVNSSVEGNRSVDSDNDGAPDREDLDDDNDGVPTSFERLVNKINDLDNDGRPNRIDTDDDGDTWSTADELKIAFGAVLPPGDVLVRSGAYLIDSDFDSRLDRDEGKWDGFVPVPVPTVVDCVALATDVDPGHVTIVDPANAMWDFDGDGTHDLLDLDDDGDGHLTLLEGIDDIDGDGCPNHIDLDLDGDGKPDNTEGMFTDNDLDGLNDLYDSDDNDGGLVDSDGDGVLTIDENLGVTLPLDPDTSCGDVRRFTTPGITSKEIIASCGADNRGDLALDGLELGPAPDHFPVDRDNDGIDDWQDDDDDNDGVPTRNEVGFACAPGEDAVIVRLTVQGSNDPYLQCLAPKAKLPTYYKVVLGTPGVGEVTYVDTDGDGLLDFQDPDDDGDGVPTADELVDGQPNDHDGDGIADHLDQWDEDGPLGDADADGIPSDIEEALGLDPLRADSDGDGVLDDQELGDDWDNPLDSDGDGIIDALDEDDDGDGVPTAEESRGDTDGDGIPDYLDSDSDGDGVDDGDEHGLDDDCDGDADDVDPIVNEGLCNQAAFDPGYYEPQECSCGTVSPAGGLLGWALVALGWMGRRRR